MSLNQGILYTPTHLPRPGRGISEAALDEVLALTEASGGGMLGLESLTGPLSRCFFLSSGEREDGDPPVPPHRQERP